MSFGKQLPQFRWYQDHSKRRYLFAKKRRNFLGDLNHQNFEDWSSYSPCSTVLQKLTVLQPRNSPHLTQPVGSLPHSQAPTTCPYCQPDRSSPCPSSHFSKIHFNVLIPFTPESSKWALSLRSHHQ